MRFSAAVVAVLSAFMAVDAKEVRPGGLGRLWKRRLSRNIIVEKTKITPSTTTIREAEAPRPLWALEEEEDEVVSPLWDNQDEDEEDEEEMDQEDVDLGILSSRFLQDSTCDDDMGTDSMMECDCSKFNEVTYTGSFSCIETQENGAKHTTTYDMTSDLDFSVMMSATTADGNSYGYGMTFEGGAAVSCSLQVGGCDCECSLGVCPGNGHLLQKEIASFKCPGVDDPIDFCALEAEEGGLADAVALLSQAPKCDSGSLRMAHAVSLVGSGAVTAMMMTMENWN